MLRLVLVGLLFLAVPALALAQDDPKDKNGAGEKAKDSDKKDAKNGSTTETGQGIYHRTWYERVVDVGVTIMPLVQIVLLCLILFSLFGLRSDIGRFLEKRD